jgi:hypothetical protein
MSGSVEHILTVEQRVFVMKTFYQTDNKSETYRRFDEEFNRQIKRDTVADIVYRFKERWYSC